MQSLFLLLSIVGYLYFFCVYSKCKLIQAPFYVVTFIICFLYIFAVIGSLELGAYICLACGMLLGVVAAYLNRAHYQGVKNWSALPKNNLYEICYLIPLAIILLAIPSSYQFMDWDEFSFWGLSIKIIAAADTLYNSSYPTEYNHYPPGQQLFQYFIVKFTGWSEKNALYAHIVLSFSVLLYIAGSFYKSASFKTVLAFFAACMLMYCFGFAYASVYSDKLVAFYFCAALVFAYFAKNEIIDLVFLCLVLITLVLIKQIGLLMALLVIAVYCVSIFPRYSSFNPNSTNKSIVIYFHAYRFLVIAGICLLGAVYFSYQSWEWYVDSIGANKNFYSPSLLEFLEGERLQMLGATLSEFIKRIQIPSFIIVRDMSISLLNTTFIFLVVSIIGVVLCDSSRRVRLGLILGTLFVGWIGYIIFHLYAYQVFFGRWEALALSSFERYAAIYCLSWMLFLYFYITSHVFELKSKIASILVLIFCCATVIGLYPKLRWDIGESFTSYNYDILQRINSDKAMVDAHVKNEDSVYFISQGATAYDRWAFYYAVYPKMKRFNPWSLCAARDGYACSYKDLSEGLVGDHYLMLSKADDYFWEQAGHLFDPSEYGSKSGLYAIEYKDGIVVRLTRVSQSLAK